MSLNTKVLFVALVALAIANYAFAVGPIECNRPNEQYECGSACQTTCENLGKACQIVNIRCNDSCYCIKGYARKNGETGPCIPISEC